jgi:hypothetical protein
MMDKVYSRTKYINKPEKIKITLFTSCYNTHVIPTFLQEIFQTYVLLIPDGSKLI